MSIRTNIEINQIELKERHVLDSLKYPLNARFKILQLSIKERKTKRRHWKVSLQLTESCQILYLIGC